MYFCLIDEFNSIIFNLFIFNWGIIALQCHVGFCHTSVGISHRYTHVPHLLNLPPTSHPIFPFRSSQSTRLSAQHHTANAHRLYFIHGYVRVSLLPSQFVYLLLPQLCLQVWSPCLHFCCCPSNKFIITTF